MRIGVIGDVHRAWAVLDPVLRHLSDLRCDAVVLVGDLANGGHVSRPRPREVWLADAHEVIERVQTLGVPVFAVPGNHDQPDLGHPADVDGRVVSLDGFTIAGVGGAGPARFGFPYEWREREVEARLPGPGVDLLLCHAPPEGVLDRTVHGQHVGSRAIAEWVRAAGPGFLVCGHIHECGGVQRVGERIVLNAGGLGKPFGRAQVGVIEREAGVDRGIWRVLETGEEVVVER